MRVSKLNKLSGLCNIRQKAGMLCEHDLMHGLSLPVVANPHLTNPSPRDLNRTQRGAVTRTVLGKVMKNGGGEQRVGCAYSSLNNNNCQGPPEKKKKVNHKIVLLSF